MDSNPATPAGYDMACVSVGGAGAGGAGAGGAMGGTPTAHMDSAQ